MSHLYEIATGRWWYEGALLGTCHSGTDLDGDGQTDPGEGHNDPGMIAVNSVGPIPPGVYEIGDPCEHPTAGLFTMRLRPLQPEVMYGRSGFLFHGGGPRSSRGCIVGARSLRERVYSIVRTVGDRRLVVVARLAPTPAGP